MKLPCGYCGFENIEGVDECEKCGQPQDDLHLKQPQSEIERGLLKDKVSVLSAKNPVTVSESTTVGEVLNILVEKSIGCVFIVDSQKKLKGVFSERDALMRLNAEASQLSARPISEFMTPNPQGLKANSKIAYALHQMDLGHYRHIPILDDSNFTVGVISVRDILRYLIGMAS